VISVREAASFAVGKADLDPEAERLFHEIGVTLAEVPNAVRVEGHTDDVPISTTRFRSNWELSTARATSVVAYFVEHVGLAPDRLSAAGYGEFHPQVSNDSDHARAKNRRVDVVVLNPQTRDREEPGAGLRAGR
jgi:chemotaxis protein MotB